MDNYVILRQFYKDANLPTWIYDPNSNHFLHGFIVNMYFFNKWLEKKKGLSINSTFLDEFELIDYFIEWSKCNKEII